MSDNSKKTSLYNIHKEYGGKIVDFFGWLLPVQYSGIIEEHNIVRNNAGIFDVSHMGEIIIEGKTAEKFIQRIITNNIEKIEDNKIMYSPMCYEDGGVVDDVIIYKFNKEKYLMIANASNVEKDYNWLLKNKIEGVNLLDVSDEIAQIAIQGPKSQKILQKLTNYDLEKLKFFSFKNSVLLGEIEVLISRSGYTGEDGFEIYLNPKESCNLWHEIMAAGKEDGILPCGLGARDTLRLEACLPLYGHELSKDISPVEAGLKNFINLDTDFIGNNAVLKQLENTERIIVGFEMIERGIARENYKVIVDNKVVGYVTSGSYSPTLEKNIGLALIDKQFSGIDNLIDIAVRKKRIKAKIIKKPFYRKKYKR